jgi:hypothetical protein
VLGHGEASEVVAVVEALCSSQVHGQLPDFETRWKGQMEGKNGKGRYRPNARR